MMLWVVKLGTSLLRGDTAAVIEGYGAAIAAAIGDAVRRAGFPPGGMRWRKP